MEFKIPIFQPPTPPPTDNKAKFDSRMELIGLEREDHLKDGYTTWFLTKEKDIIVRSYDKHIQLHLWMDSDTYQTGKNIPYKSLTYEASNNKFLFMLVLERRI